MYISPAWAWRLSVVARLAQTLDLKFQVLRISTLLSALLAALLLPACAVYEVMGGMPYAESEIAVTSQPTTARVLGCVQTAIQSLSPLKETTIAPGATFKSKHGWWSTNFTKLNIADGVLESGDYSESNVAGVRVRAVYSPQTAILRLQLKAAGPYYVDLGAREHMNQLRSRVEPCVDA